MFSMPLWLYIYYYLCSVFETAKVVNKHGYGKTEQQ